MRHSVVFSKSHFLIEFAYRFSRMDVSGDQTILGPMCIDARIKTLESQLPLIHAGY
jgi:hypothetical protein